MTILATPSPTMMLNVVTAVVRVVTTNGGVVREGLPCLFTLDVFISKVWTFLTLSKIFLMMIINVHGSSDRSNFILI